MGYEVDVSRKQKSAPYKEKDMVTISHHTRGEIGTGKLVKRIMLDGRLAADAVELEDGDATLILLFTPRISGFYLETLVSGSASQEKATDTAKGKP